tara:strand:+ start:2253 stop:2654 length:402 start_codon:yes stop_codon:yes gene_type:complete
MAALVPTLTLTGTAADFGAALAVSETDSISVGAPIIGVSTASITTTGANNIIAAAADSTKLVYVKHTGVDAGGSAVTTDLTIETTGDVVFGKLNAGEFAWIPHYSPLNSGANGVQLQASSGTIVAEYAVFSHT